MQRITISVSDEFAAELEAFANRRHYPSRSEAVRDLARIGLKEAAATDHNQGTGYATVTYVYDHHKREIPRRLTNNYHSHRDLAVTTLHIHVDDDTCLEVAVLKGDGGTIREFANALIAERGVRYGQLNFVPSELDGHDCHAPALSKGKARAHRHEHR